MSDVVEPIKILADLIQQQLDLGVDDVWIYNQNYPIPPEKKMFVTLGILAKTPFGTSSNFDGAGEGLVETQGMNVQETYSIMAYSQDSTARIRCHEILWALSGVPAQQAQEKYAFRIGTLPTSFVDVSAIEGASRLNRYSLTFRALVAYQRRRSVEYFDRYAQPPYTLITNP